MVARECFVILIVVGAALAPPVVGTRYAIVGDGFLVSQSDYTHRATVGDGVLDVPRVHGALRVLWHGRAPTNVLRRAAKRTTRATLRLSGWCLILQDLNFSVLRVVENCCVVESLGANYGFEVDTVLKCVLSYLHHTVGDCIVTDVKPAQSANAECAIVVMVPGSVRCTTICSSEKRSARFSIIPL